MGEGNIAEFAAARDGRERLTEYCRADAGDLLAGSPEQLADAFRPHLSDVDARALTGELAAFLLESLTAASSRASTAGSTTTSRSSRRGDSTSRRSRFPSSCGRASHDLMVPAGHARWLRRHVAGAEGRVLQEDGHLTLFADRVGDVHAWLQDRLT